MNTVKAKLTFFGLCSGLITGLIIVGGFFLSGGNIYFLTAGALLGAILGALVFYLLSRPLSKAINYLIDFSNQIVQGDLTLSMDTGAMGEFSTLGLNLEKICKGMSAYFSRSLENVKVLDQAGEQISASTSQISKGTQDQADQVQQLLRSVEDFAASAKNSAEEAEGAARLAGDTDQAARQGDQALKKVVEGMNIINSRIAELGENSSKIGQIVDVIDDIAAQTNLLALNAAIEAARAGEHGRGFAVVAEEVRHLAENSSNATKEIGQLVTTIQEGTKEAVEAVDQGIGLIENAGESFRSIQELITETTSLIQDLALSAKKQAATSENLLSGAQTIAAVSEEAAASTEEAAAVAQELPVFSKKIVKSVSVFKIQ
ncbi:MAG TPA: methyl-accepting chemotaxis protein [Bacillota bacterium]|nr:methyl-accepting chemotaxis protein [Bacillota bacterium]